MAIEVLERGNSPREKVYKAKCSKCASVLRFCQHDIKEPEDIYNVGQFITCTVCGEDIWSIDFIDIT